MLWYKQNFERLELNEDKSKASEDSQNVVSRTREWLRNEKMRITTADRVARRFIVFTIAKECAFV